jgi:peptidoglycan/LPS O-acetylase OafA/YrhL
MKRVPQPDGVRGIAILMVLVWHYFVCSVNVMHTPVAYAARALSLTWSGVDAFFVLSGFLIVGVLVDHRDASNYFRVFYVRRVCRIFPVYFLLLAIGAIALRTVPAGFPSHDWLLSRPLPLWSYATFTQNIAMGLRGDFGPSSLSITWSLAAEEQFYLLIPLIVYYVSGRKLAAALAAGIAVAPLLRWMVPGFIAFVGTPWRGDSLLAGGCVALLGRSPALACVARARRTLLAAFLALLMGAAVLTVAPASLGVFDHLWLAALYAVFVLVAYVDALPALTRVLRAAALVWVGQLSYAIYMFHQAIGGALHGWHGNSAPMLRTPSDAAVTTAALGATLLLAAISHRLVEQPFLRLGHRLQYSPGRGVAGPALHT